MTKNDWIKDILSDYMDIAVIEYLMKENLVEQIKKYFELHNISITELDFDDNGIKAVIVYKDNKIIAFAHFDCLDDKLDVGRSLEEKNNTIKQLTEKLQRFQSQYHDYKATCTKIIDDQRAENLELQEKNRILSQLKDVNVKSIQELCIKVLYRDKKIEELSTKLAEVVVNRDAFKTALLVKCSEVGSLEEDKNELINKLGEALTENVKYEDKVEDLESTIEGQKEQIAGLENRINVILSIPVFKLSNDYKTSMGGTLQ